MKKEEKYLLTLEELLVLAKDIKKDFQEIMVPEIPMYMEGPRATELMEMIEEIKSGKLKRHPRFSYCASMDTDELTGHRELMCKVSDFDMYFNRTAP
jgi:hypothetical protein